MNVTKFIRNIYGLFFLGGVGDDFFNYEEKFFYLCWKNISDDFVPECNLASLTIEQLNNYTINHL